MANICHTSYNPDTRAAFYSTGKLNTDSNCQSDCVVSGKSAHTYIHLYIMMESAKSSEFMISEIKFGQSRLSKERVVTISLLTIAFIFMIVGIVLMAVAASEKKVDKEYASPSSSVKQVGKECSSPSSSSNQEG